MAASPFITFSAIRQKLPNNPRPSLSHFSSHHITSIILLTIPTNFPSISHFIFTLLSLSSSSEMLAFAWSLWAKLTATGESSDPALPVASKSEPSKLQVVVVRQPCAVPPCAVPPSLPQIEPILLVAEEVKRINPRVGYLCRFYALEKSHRLDPTTRGEGVRTFKTLLVVQLDKEHVSSLRVRKKKSDELEILCFYQQYYRNYIQALKNAVTEADFANLAKDYQTVYVLYEVWKSLQLPRTIQDREEMLVRMIERATNEVTGVRRSNEVPIVRPPPSPTPLP